MSLEVTSIIDDVDHVAVEILDIAEDVEYIVQAFASGDVAVWCVAGPNGELFEVCEDYTDYLPLLATALFAH